MVRTLLIADVALLIVAGFISLIWVGQPAGTFIAMGMWLGAGGLLGLLPFTDRYRVEQRTNRRERQRRS